MGRWFMSARRGDNRAAQLGARAAGTQIKLTGPPDERTGSCLSKRRQRQQQQQEDRILVCLTLCEHTTSDCWIQFKMTHKGAFLLSALLIKCSTIETFSDPKSADLALCLQPQSKRARVLASCPR